MAFKKIMRWLMIPTDKLTEENARSARLLAAMIVTMTLVMFIWNAFVDSTILPLKNRLIINITATVCMVVIWYLLRRRKVKAASILAVTGFFILVLVASLLDNGVQSPAFAGLALITIIGGFLLGETAVLVGAVATILSGLGLVYIASMTNWLHAGSTPFSAWLSHSIYITITAVITSMAIRITNGALARAQKELADRVLAESELSKFRKGIEQSEEAVFMTDPGGIIRYVNPAFEKTYGYTSSEMIGQTPRLIKSGLMPLGAYEQFWQTLLSKKVAPVEFINRRKDGRLVMVEGSASPVTNDHGEITGFLAIQHDVTARKQAEQALQESSEKVQAMFNNMTDGIIFLDLEGRILDINDTGVRMHGYDRKEELVGTIAFNMIEDNDQDRVRQKLVQAVETGVAELLEFRIRRKDGSFFEGEVKGTLLRDKSGKPIGLVTLTRDISQRKASESALRASEERFRSFVEETSDAVSIVDETGLVIEWNRSAERITGMKKEEVLNKPVWDVLFSAVPPSRRSPERYQSLKDRYHKSIETGQAPWPERPIVEFFHADGSIRYGEQNSFMMKTERGYRIGNVLTDVTERKAAEMQVEQQIRRLTELHTIDVAITGGLPLAEIFETIKQIIHEELAIDAVGILMLNKQTNTLDVVSVSGFYSDEWAREAKLDVNTCFSGRAAREERILMTEIQPHPTEEFRLIHLLKSESFHNLIVAPLITKHQVLGVVEIFMRRPFTPSSEWLSYLETLATQAAIAIDNRTLFDDLQRMNAELENSYDVTLDGWSRALDLRDEETEGHTRRVMEMSVDLARVLGFSDTDLANIRRGALLHDIGKMGVPDKILNKPGPLDDEEWAVMKQHPEFAYNLLSPVAHLRGALDIPYCHHERWDGTGYPRGLKGDEIPLVARVFAVADVWDALTSDRCYRPAWTHDQALGYIRQQSGKHFDPAIVEVFLRLVDGEHKPGS